MSLIDVTCVSCDLKKNFLPCLSFIISYRNSAFSCLSRTKLSCVERSTDITCDVGSLLNESQLSRVDRAETRDPLALSVSKSGKRVNV